MRIALLTIAVFLALVLVSAYVHEGLIGLVDVAAGMAFFAALLAVIWLIRRFIEG